MTEFACDCPVESQFALGETSMQKNKEKCSRTKVLQTNFERKFVKINYCTESIILRNKVRSRRAKNS